MFQFSLSVFERPKLGLGVRAYNGYFIFWTLLWNLSLRNCTRAPFSGLEGNCSSFRVVLCMLPYMWFSTHWLLCILIVSFFWLLLFLMPRTCWLNLQEPLACAPSSSFLVCYFVSPNTDTARQTDNTDACAHLCPGKCPGCLGLPGSQWPLVFPMFFVFA